MYIQLIQQGYNSLQLDKLIYIIGNFNRNELIKYKNKSEKNFKFNGSFGFKIMFNNKISTKLLIKNTINNAILSNKFPQIDTKPFYGVTNNIGSTLIHKKELIIHTILNQENVKMKTVTNAYLLILKIK
jgi:hypothetical protein